jgi:hypothetical protein
LTAGTRRNGTSKFGPYRPATPGRLAELDSQAQYDRDFAEIVSYGEPGYRGHSRGQYGYDPHGGPAAYGDVRPFGYDGAFGQDGPLGLDGPFGHQWPTVQVVPSVREDREGRPAGPGSARRPGSAARAADDPEPRRGGGRHAARHASPRESAIRKRAGKVVPVAAVAAALAAGTGAAYGLSGGGHPQAGNPGATLTLHGGVAQAAAPDAGHPNAAGTGSASTGSAGTGLAGAPSTGVSAAPVGVATATASRPARAPRHAKTAPRRTPAATLTPTATHPTATASAPAPATHAAAPAATHSAAPVASSSPTATKPASAATLSCNLGYGMLPANVTAIVSFLLAHGYSDNAAAGIAGNIYQESKGDPESEGMGGGGLIGWTPLPAGFVTGNVSADLQTQLSAVLTYNQGWAQYLPALNAAASPAAAADIYVTDFERAGIPAASTREASAQNTASACGI